ncbi:hypothetical protein L1887_14573 [Cichorium endivia]|nr:hypothetical protein L1887_14573 [Cichorium endivia]
MTDLEQELKNTKARLDEAERESKKKIKELEDQVAKAQQSESKMLESLMFQTQEMMQIKMDLEESKLEVASLYERLENGGNNTPRGNYNYNQNQHQQPSPETKALKDEIAKLKNDLKIAMESEEKSKKAMDGLASALQEVATEASMTNEKLRLTEEKLTDLTSEFQRLSEELEIQKETADQLRVESEESYLTWTAKEIGFVTCIKKSDEEAAAAKHENNRLKEALVSAESTTRIAREEAFKLRDILKQALNESNVAKEAANIARSENAELKDLLAEKEDALHFLTKENERLRINEVAARENVKEFKRLLAAKAEAEKFYDDKEHNDDFNSPLSSLYEDHLDARGTPRKTFSFDLDDLKVFNKDDDLLYHDGEESVADIGIREDPEKAEALKGSIFDMSASPRSEPQTPRYVLEHCRSTSVADAGGSGQVVQAEEGDNAGSSGHTEEGDYVHSYYSRKKLFKKIGELIVGKPTSFFFIAVTTHHSSGFSGYTTAGWKKVALYYGPYGSKDS